MKKIKVAFQGEMGAYSHLACNEIFPNSEIKSCPTFEETFKTAYDDENFKKSSMIHQNIFKNKIINANRPSSIPLISWFPSPCSSAARWD